MYVTTYGCTLLYCIPPPPQAFSLNPYTMVQHIKQRTNGWNFVAVLVVGVIFQLLYILYRNTYR